MAGWSAGRIGIGVCPETLPFLVDGLCELRTVRQGWPNGPLVGLEFVPETLLPLGGLGRSVADGPLRGSGQSAV